MTIIYNTASCHSPILPIQIPSVKIYFMKKVILAFDGSDFSEGAFAFAKHMNLEQPILLVGVFLPQIDYSNLWSYANGTAGTFFIPLVEDEEAETIEKNIRRFQKLCASNNIDNRIHKDFYDFTLPELKKETRFADLVILGSESFYKNFGQQELNQYLKDAVHSAECPVIVVPEKCNYPEFNILAFDGSESSVHAIKQYAYLFPDLCSNKTMLIYATNKEREIAFPDESYIVELAARHFKDLTLFKLDFDSKKHFATWINDKDNAILVSGAFGRSFFSQLFKPSFVSEVIKSHKLPVFITHR
jgi:hypothetical protein